MTTTVPLSPDHLMRWFRGSSDRPKHFGLRQFRRREELCEDYSTLAESLLHLVEFQSVLDVGCANGFLLASFASAGRRIAGIEISSAVHEVLPPAVAAAVEVGDFTQIPAIWTEPFDLVCCVEVAEHIEPGRSEELVRVLTGSAGRWIYFTAAAPGQPGRGHINCRPHEGWLAWFAAAGWHVADRETAALRADVERLPRAYWLAGNSFLLTRSEVVD